MVPNMDRDVRKLDQETNSNDMAMLVGGMFVFLLLGLCHLSYILFLAEKQYQYPMLVEFALTLAASGIWFINRQLLLMNSQFGYLDKVLANERFGEDRSWAEYKKAHTFRSVVLVLSSILSTSAVLNILDRMILRPYPQYSGFTFWFNVLAIVIGAIMIPITIKFARKGPKP